MFEASFSCVRARADLRLSALLVAAVVTIPASVALAANCGDHIGGERVACACGDVVVSDTRLQASDPVVSSPCPGNGLLVQAQSGGRSIRLDLGGLTIRGMGHGVGIRVLDGGQTGAVIVGGDHGQRGRIRGFRNGVRAYGRTSLATLTAVDVDDNAREGVRLWGSEARVADVRARGNGGTGVRVSGRSPVLEHVETRDNARDGVHVTGRSPRVTGLASSGNAREQARLPRAGASR
jgi:hypothetical protein